MCNLLLEVCAGGDFCRVRDALDRAVDKGVENLLVKPAFLMYGYEYNRLYELLVKEYAGKFKSIRVSAPLLDSLEDFKTAAAAMVDAVACFNDSRTAVCYMGHGSKTTANTIYNKMQDLLHANGHANYFVGTLNKTTDASSLEDIIKLVQDGGYTRVVLRPMMITAGKHASIDMAGDHADSWKNAFIAAGIKAENVICEVKGLGEIPAIQELLADHARNAVPLRVR